MVGCFDMALPIFRGLGGPGAHGSPQAADQSFLSDLMAVFDLCFAAVWRWCRRDRLSHGKHDF